MSGMCRTWPANVVARMNAGIIWDAMTANQRERIRRLGVTDSDDLAALFLSFNDDPLDQPSVEETALELIFADNGLLTMRESHRRRNTRAL
jgi:hypothetical protein